MNEKKNRNATGRKLFLWPVVCSKDKNLTSSVREPHAYRHFLDSCLELGLCNKNTNKVDACLFKTIVQSLAQPLPLLIFEWRTQYFHRVFLCHVRASLDVVPSVCCVVDEVFACSDRKGPCTEEDSQDVSSPLASHKKKFSTRRAFTFPANVGRRSGKPSTCLF